MGFVPSNCTTTCWPALSPHKLGTCDAPPDMDMMSLLQVPSPFGGAKDKSENTTRNWQTVFAHGFTVNEHLHRQRAVGISLMLL